MKTLNVIGAGHLGKTLARLWVDAGTYRIGGVLNTTLTSAESAIAFIGSGVPVESIEGMPDYDHLLIATPDGSIEPVCRQLVNGNAEWRDKVVFHCSGSLASDVLSSAGEAGAQVASVHPVASFASPDRVIRSFAGTHCGTEGSDSAVAELTNSFEAIGGTCFAIEPAAKAVYHAASVVGCNYLVTLLQTSLELYQEAGVSEKLARKLLAPIASATVENLFEMGAGAALTGPIARGEVEVVGRHLQALELQDPLTAKIYRTMGLKTVLVAADSKKSERPELELIERMLKG